MRRKDAFVGFFSWYIDKANVFEEAASWLQKTAPCPHICSYKPQITSILSITHRITGVGMMVAWSSCPGG